MAGSPRREKQQRILLPHGVRFFSLPKKFLRILKLGMEFLLNLRAYLVAARVNSGPDSGSQITCRGAIVAVHFAHTLLHDSFQGAAPSCMKHPNGAIPRVNENDWNAIGGQNSKQKTGRIGYQPITAKRLLRPSLYGVDKIRMNLADGHQRPGLPIFGRCQSVEEGITISFYRSI